MDLGIGDRVFYTRSNGLQPPATVVGTAEDGLLHLEYRGGGGISPGENFVGKISPLRKVAKFSPGETLA